jgi:hypothetical protein
VPIGIELLGAAFAEAPLLTLGYAVEQTLALRRAPFSTPALRDGKAPAAITTMIALGGPVSGKSSPALTLTYDATTSRLEYSATPNPSAVGIDAIWLHTGTAEKPGAARLRLYGPGQPPKGHVVLAAADRRDLAAGRLLIRLYPSDRGTPRDLPLTLGK